MSRSLLRTMAGILTVCTACSVWAGEKPDPSSPLHHVPVTEFMAQKPKKKRWWWRPLEMLGFKQEEEKPAPQPLDKDRQGPRVLPGTGVGSYRQVGN